MADPLERCAWPPLAEPYRSALREAVAYAFARFAPFGIVASGSIIRGNPDPESDLDIWVFHREPWRQRVQTSFAGVRVELFVNPPGRTRRYLDEEPRGGASHTAHILATGVVIFADDPVVEELRERSHAVLAAGPRVPESALKLGLATKIVRPAPA